MPESTNETPITISLSPNTILDILDALHTTNNHSDNATKGAEGPVVTAIKGAMRAKFDELSSAAEAQPLPEEERLFTEEEFETDFAEFATSLHTVMRLACCSKKEFRQPCNRNC